MLYAFVQKGNAQKVKEYLSEHQLLIKGAPVIKRGETVGFPISKAGDLEIDASLEEVDVRAPEPAKRWRGEGGFPRAFDFIGDIAIIRLKPGYDLAEARDKAKALMEANPPIKAVFARLGPLGGQYRISSLVHLAGEERTLTLYRENGSSFWVDAATSFFSPRLSHERSRVSSLTRRGERVLDMFAGVGPFAVQIAKAGATVFACEINPSAFSLMNKNVALNGVQDRVRTFPGDAAILASSQARGWAQRIIMNVPSSSLQFLEAAITAAAPSGATIHLYVRSSHDPTDALRGRDGLSVTRLAVLKEVSSKEKIYALDLRANGRA
ncbi:MAG: class I SAM-dependent methyltransferase [Thermoprotei archaeon]